MTRKAHKPSPNQRLASRPSDIWYTIIRVYLQSNCQREPYYEKLLGYVRSRNRSGLFRWAESCTEVSQDLSAYRREAQLVALISKYDDGLKEDPFNDGLDQESRALLKFHKAEAKCKITNRRFSSSRWESSSFANLVKRMRHEIARVLGETPRLEDIYDKCDFNSGASLKCGGMRTHLASKLKAVWTCTPGAVFYLPPALRRNFHYMEFLDSQNGYVCYDVNRIARKVWSKVEFVHCNKISFVPKTAKTLRSIAVEPTVNAFLQKGVDLEIRKLLKSRANIDLGNDFEKNRELARRGSIDGTYFTMDLSSASDTVATELVRVLLPDDWYSLLSALRSPSYELDGGVTHYQKFVSMGNGFCFPLETLIFASAVKACKGELGLNHTSSSVYGDDIVADSRLYDILRKLLAFCGFIINDEKTYASGPFRESCGADWYSGQDVRPVYLKSPITRLTELIGFHNVCYRSPEIYDLMREVMSYLRRLAGSNTYYQPFEGFGTLSVSNYGDSAFAVERDLFMTGRWVRWDRSLQTWIWRGILSRPVPDVGVRPLASYISFLRGSPSGDLYLRYTTNHSTRYNV